MIETDIIIAGGVFVKPHRVALAMTTMQQHAHKYDHVSYIAAGAARVWADDMLIGDFVAPCGVVIRANVQHSFQTMLDDTVIICIHNIGDAESVEFAEHDPPPVGV